MKKKVIPIAIFFLPFFLPAQNVMKVQSGATIKTTGGAVITLQDMDLDNDGTINQELGEGVFKFTGTQNNSISGISLPLFDVLEIAKTGSAKLLLNRNISIGSSINFTSGLIDLNNNNILLQAGALLNGENESSRIFGDNDGFIEITQTFNAPSSVNPGNLGAIISSAQNLGSTVIRRGHKFQTIGSNQSVKRYFDIIPSNNSSLNATLRFQYFDAEMNSLDENIVVLYRSPDNTNWTEFGIDNRNTATNFTEKNGIASFSRWTMFNPADALPVIFTLINGHCENGKIVITWKTAQERNSSRFDIQRSVSGTSWTVIGSIIAAGNSYSEKTYSFTDINPLPAGGTYRIAQYDADGKVHYTSIVRSSCDRKDGINLWPNPTQDIAWLNINTSASNKVTVKLYDVKGSLISVQAATLLPGSNQLSVSVEKLSAGIYELRVEWDMNKVKTFKLIKY